MTGTYVPFSRPRPLSDWVIDGTVPEGFEANGRLFPWRVMDQPAQFVVIGEVLHTDGRRVLDFAMNPDWIEANTDYAFRGDRFPSYYCPDCDGKGEGHQRVEVPSKTMGKSVWVKCPRDTSGRR